MDRSPILFRCDGNPQAGWESFYQCLHYASALQRRRRPCHFLGQYAPIQLLSQIARGGNEFITSDHSIGTSEDCDATIRAIRQHRIAGVVVAAPGVSMEYLRELSSAGALVAVIDSEAKVRFPTRMVINPLLGPEKRSYAWENGTQLLLGSRYSLVRSIFRRQRSVRVVEPQAPYRVLLAFGDDDCTGQSLLRSKEILAGSRVDKVSVVVRSHHFQIEELRALATQSEGRMEVITETTDLSTRLPRAHFVVTSGDGVALEMACVGIPQLIMTQCHRHAQNALVLDQERAAILLGDATQVTNMQFREAIANLLDDPLERIGMARSARQLIDGRGPDRLVNALELMLHPVRPADDQRLAA